MKTKEYIVFGLIVFGGIILNNYLTKPDNSSEFFLKLLEREDAHQDSLRKKDLKIADLRASKQSGDNNYYYNNSKATDYLEKPIEVTKKDSSNCMPIINSLFECKDILFGYQKSSLNLNRINDSLIFELDDKIKIQDELLQIKDQKFDNAPQKSSMYLTFSGSIQQKTFSDFEIGAFYATKKRLGFGYEYGILNETHKAKVGILLFRHK